MAITWLTNLISRHLLSALLFLPLAGGLALLAIPSGRINLLRWWANIVAAATLAASLFLLASFRTDMSGFQMVERHDWIPTIGAEFLLGIDGISLLLVLLTTLISFLAVWCSWNSALDRPKLYYAMLLLLETGVLGVFLSLDLFLFYLFWDVVLIPMYFIIGIYGGPRRSYAAIKFFLYTLLGSVFMLLGFLALYFQYAQKFGVYTFDLTKLMQLSLDSGTEQWIFFALFLGFAVKIPMFPFHTWLPDAHVEAPTAGSVLLASLLLKMGTYGFMRFSLPLLPRASMEPWIVNTMVALSLIAIIYGALICLTQRDWKRLVAYSSVSHLGFCTLGIFALNESGLVRQHHPTGEPRYHHRAVIPAGGVHLRTPALARNRGFRRLGASDAGLCHRVCDHCFCISRPAFAEWLYWRVLHSLRSVRGELDLGAGRRNWSDFGRGLFALAIPANDARSVEVRSESGID